MQWLSKLLKNCPDCTQTVIGKFFGPLRFATRNSVEIRRPDWISERWHPSSSTRPKRRPSTNWCVRCWLRCQRQGCSAGSNLFGTANPSTGVNGADGNGYAQQRCQPPTHWIVKPEGLGPLKAINAQHAEEHLRPADSVAPTEHVKTGRAHGACDHS